MLIKTHLAFAIIFIILFFQHVSNKIVFVGVLLLATILPDIDMSTSRWGKHLIFRPIQFFIKHRGIVHSFTLGIVISIILAVVWPVGCLGFFVGFSVHLLGDSFTVEGIQPFWPSKAKSYGFIRTGGKIEESLFFSLIFFDIFLFFVMFVF